MQKKFENIFLGLLKGYLENTDNISGRHGHGQHAKSNPNCNPNPNPDYYFT